MGKIFSPPKEIGECPRFADFVQGGGKFDRDGMFEAERLWEEKLREWCKKHSKNELAGEIIKDQVADGYAKYMVFSTKPVQLIHLPLGDAYESRWAHRWTASDIKSLVKAERSLQELFKKIKG